MKLMILLLFYFSLKWWSEKFCLIFTNETEIPLNDHSRGVISVFPLFQGTILLLWHPHFRFSVVSGGYSLSLAPGVYFHASKMSHFLIFRKSTLFSKVLALGNFKGSVRFLLERLLCEWAVFHFLKTDPQYARQVFAGFDNLEIGDADLLLAFRQAFFVVVTVLFPFWRDIIWLIIRFVCHLFSFIASGFYRLWTRMLRHKALRVFFGITHLCCLLSVVNMALITSAILN